LALLFALTKKAIKDGFTGYKLSQKPWASPLKKSMIAGTDTEIPKRIKQHFWIGLSDEKNLFFWHTRTIKLIRPIKANRSLIKYIESPHLMIP
jgi:hypothetical protein